jgi:hypothetical protein
MPDESTISRQPAFWKMPGYLDEMIQLVDPTGIIPAGAV